MDLIPDDIMFTSTLLYRSFSFSYISFLALTASDIDTLLPNLILFKVLFLLKMFLTLLMINTINELIVVF